MLPVLHMIVVAAGGMAAAWVLRRAGARVGIGVLGGILAGVLLGPTVLGRIAPTWYERVIIGGQVEREALHNLQRAHGSDQIARDFVNMPAAEAQAAREAEGRAEQQARGRWRTAQSQHQAGAKTLGVAAATATIILLSLTRPRVTGPRPHLYPVISIGLWMACAPGVLTFALLRWLDAPLWSAVAAAAAVAAGPIAVAVQDARTADVGEAGGSRLLSASARMACLVAAAVLTWALYRSAPQGFAWAAAAPAACIVSLVPLRLSSPRAHALVEHGALPAIAALIACRIELIEHFHIWRTIGIVLLCCDGRWIAAAVGAMFAGSRGVLRSLRLVLGVLAAAPIQLAFSSIALHAGVIEESAALGLLAGAAVMDVTANLRARVGLELGEVDMEVKNSRNGPLH